MRQFEQDWLELGSRVARSLHDQHPPQPPASGSPSGKGGEPMRGCGCLIAALVGLFLGLYIAGSLLTAAVH
jgi:hypothetical protein